MLKIRRSVGAAVFAIALALGTAGAPAFAQQTGLVNVSVGDVTILEDVRIGVALAVAANLCGVQVNVLAQQFRQTQRAQCRSDQGLVVVQP